MDVPQAVLQTSAPRALAATHEMKHWAQQGERVFPFDKLCGEDRPYMTELTENSADQLMRNHQRNRDRHSAVAAQ